jgi:nitroreductase
MEVSCHQEIAGDSAFAVAMVARFKERIASAAAAYRRLYWECGMIGQVLYLEAEARGLRGTGIGCFFDDPVHELLGIKNLSNQSLYHFTVGHPIEDTRLATLPAYHHLER